MLESVPLDPELVRVNTPGQRQYLTGCEASASTGTVPRVVLGEARWSGEDTRAALDLAGLPEDTPVTALAVELLPEPDESRQARG